MKKLFVTFIGILFVVTTYAQPSEGSGFYRVVNGNSTDQCLKFVDDRISAQQIVGSASSVNNDNGVAAIGRVQNELNDDIKLVNVNTSLTDPGTIIFLDQKTLKNYDIISQGVGLVYISHCVFHGTIAGYIEVDGMPATITQVVNNNDVNLNLYTAHIRMKMYTVDQTRFLGTASNKLALTEVNNNQPNAAPLTCQWYLRKINENSTDNYFAAAPVASFTQNGKYYTTLRTAFSYTIPSGSKVKAYKVNEAIVDGELLNLEELTGTIPPGLPVIIESTSVNNADNKLKPVEPFINAVSNYESGLWTRKTSITGLDGIQNSPYLYNNYGWHSHDYDSYDSTHQSESVFSGWKAQGDGIGFFATKGYTGSTPLYKLSIKDGAVGFWEQVANGEKISGNEAYSPVQCQLFPVEKELVDIAEDGKEGISYDVIDNYLYGVEVVNGKLYAKDYGKFRYPDNNTNNAIDGMSKFYDYNEDYDQSNWVALDVANASSYVNKDLHVIGKLVDRQNPEIKVAKIEMTGPQVSSYQPNTYSPASFMGTQTSTVNGKTYFFVKPKPQELVHISWAIYGDDNKFYVNKPGNGINDAQIKGGFVASGDMLPQGASMKDFEVGKAYEFDAVVRVNEVSAGPSLLDEPYTDGGVSNIYTVYPYANISDTPTGVERLESGAQVVSVKYYNMMGVESDVPFKGVNIVVTTYDNGTRTTSKILK